MGKTAESVQRLLAAKTGIPVMKFHVDSRQVEEMYVQVRDTPDAPTPQQIRMALRLEMSPDTIRAKTATTLGKELDEILDERKYQLLLNTAVNMTGRDLRRVAEEFPTIERIKGFIDEVERKEKNYQRSIMPGKYPLNTTVHFQIERDPVRTGTITGHNHDGSLRVCVQDPSTKYGTRLFDIREWMLIKDETSRQDCAARSVEL